MLEDNPDGFLSAKTIENPAEGRVEMDIPLDIWVTISRPSNPELIVR